MSAYAGSLHTICRVVFWVFRFDQILVIALYFALHFDQIPSCTQYRRNLFYFQASNEFQPFFNTDQLSCRPSQKDVAEESRTSLSVNNAVYVPADDLQLRSVDFRTPYPTDTVHLGTHGILALGTLCLRIGKALETKKTDTPALFSSPLSPAPPAPSGKPIMFDIPPGCG